MKKGFQLQRLEGMASGAVRVFGLVIFALLSVTALIFTRFFPAGYDPEIPYNQVDFFPVTVLGTVILAALALWLGGVLTEKEERAERNLKVLLVTVLIWILAAGLLWIGWSKSTPVSDQYMIYTSAQRFLEGNYGRLEYGKYLYYYPFQLGLTAWESVVLGVFGADNYQALQIVNVLCAVLCVYAGYRITRLLSERRKTAAFYLLLMAGCFPLIIYTVYIYNDIPAFTLCMTALWQFLRYVRGNCRSGAVLMVLSLSAAVVLRNNSLI